MWFCYRWLSVTGHIVLYDSMCFQGRQCKISSGSPWFALFAGDKLRDVCYWAHDYS